MQARNLPALPVLITSARLHFGQTLSVSSGGALFSPSNGLVFLHLGKFGQARNSPNLPGFMTIFAPHLSQTISVGFSCSFLIFLIFIFASERLREKGPQNWSKIESQPTIPSSILSRSSSILAVNFTSNSSGKLSFNNPQTVLPRSVGLIFPSSLSTYERLKITETIAA